MEGWMRKMVDVLGWSGGGVRWKRRRVVGRFWVGFSEVDEGVRWGRDSGDGGGGCSE